MVGSGPWGRSRGVGAVGSRRDRAPGHRPVVPAGPGSVLPGPAGSGVGQSDWPLATSSSVQYSVSISLVWMSSAKTVSTGSR